jgi:hypothetical protein
LVLIATLTGLAACERSPQVNALLVPAFYVAVERLAEWRKRPIAAPAAPHGDWLGHLPAAGCQKKFVRCVEFAEPCSTSK